MDEEQAEAVITALAVDLVWEVDTTPERWPDADLVFSRLKKWWATHRTGTYHVTGYRDGHFSARKEITYASGDDAVIIASVRFTSEQAAKDACQCHANEGLWVSLGLF